MEPAWKAQKAEEGRYTGPVLYDRFQVLESSALKNTYVLADLAGRTLIRTTSHKAVGDIVRFDSIEEAQDYAAELAGQKVDKPVARPTPATARQPGKGKVTAASLIRAGLKAGQPDHEITKTVKKELGKDVARSLIDWYRRNG